MMDNLLAAVIKQLNHHKVMQTPLGVDSWDPRNHVSHKRAHWRHVANTIAYITWGADVEEFLSQLRLGTFLLDTYNAYRRLSMGGYGENRFLVLKVTKRPPIGLKFWPQVEGKRHIDCDFFASGKFP